MKEYCNEFFATVRKDGDSLVVTIPSRVIKFEGWKLGDELKITGKKVIPKT